MAVSPAGSGIIPSIATLATILKEAQIQIDLNVAILSEALDAQEELTTDLLQAMGIGRNVDVVA